MKNAIKAYFTTDSTPFDRACPFDFGHKTRMLEDPRGLVLLNTRFKAELENTMIKATAMTAATPTLSFIATDEHAGSRLDKYLSNVAEGLSRSFFHALIEQGRVFVDGSIAEKPRLIVHSGATIMVILPEPAAPHTPSECSIAVELVHEHEHFLIINKPAGLIVHAPNNHSTEPTVVDWILARYGEIKQVGSSDRPGIVHRLDKDTSGLLIIPRTNYAHTYFGCAFKNHSIRKTYHALVVGHPPKKGEIDAGITRDPAVRTRMATTTRLHARNFSPSRIGHIRESLTHYTVTEYLNEHSLLEVSPRTGRTHQIRVHLASIGFPIVGDAVYGTASPLIGRHALHAYSLSFSFDNHDYFFSQKAPEDFKLCYEKLAL
jgi:23S rRNA pseudouridine1911/1915/1917 synthase